MGVVNARMAIPNLDVLPKAGELDGSCHVQVNYAVGHE
jgi:hypothetical protein